MLNKLKIFQKLFVKKVKPQFEIGDFVSLNSGSPALKIVRIENDIITASWHSGEIEQEGKFSKACVYKLPKQT